MCEVCKKPFYITTPIYYPSDKLHIGHTYCTVATDAMARYKRLQGCDVMFLTGTDEHGQKIEDKAKAAGVTPQQFVDNIVAGPKGILDLWKLMNISNDRFIRTTDDYHVEAIQKIFRKMYENGDIYKGEYKGKYCTPCESFWTESQLVDGKCPDCGREVHDASEEAYFFRLSKYAGRVRELLTTTDYLQPKSRVNEMVNNFIDPGLEDLCVSRTSFTWGIPVTFDPKHVVYVWLDALTNYITALGYDPDKEVQSENFRKYWPADVHIIGKDIVRFHSIYWPIFLMALDLPLPKQIFGHPWFNFGTDKMSKSRGNVIYADKLADKFGVDGVRYYALSEMPYASDGSITYESVIGRYNTDLANNLGNLVNRTVAMTKKYFGGVIPTPHGDEGTDAELKSVVSECVKKFCENIDTFHIADACADVFAMLRRANKYIDETAPWILAKDEANRTRLATVLYHLLEVIRIISTALSAFMPTTMPKVWEQIGATEADVTYEKMDQFGVLPADVTVQKGEILFPRIDVDKEIEELNQIISANLPADQKPEEPAFDVPELAEEIDIETFAKVDMRVAKVTACEKVKKSKKLLRLQLDDGMGGRQVVSGIAPWYAPEDLIGKKIVLVANLKPAKLCGVESCGMICAADGADGAVKVLFADESLPCGAKVR